MPAGGSRARHVLRTPANPARCRLSRHMKRWLPEIGNAALIALGILSAAMGLKGFLLSSNFIDGGVTGVSMLLAKTTGVSLSVLLPLVNLPFIALGYRQMGRAFAVRSVVGEGSVFSAVLPLTTLSVQPTDSGVTAAH